MAASLFRPATELLVQYARYHRDPRNMASHFLGIPLIVLAWVLSNAWYLSRGNLALGVEIGRAHV